MFSYHLPYYTLHNMPSSRNFLLCLTFSVYTLYNRGPTDLGSTLPVFSSKKNADVERRHIMWDIFVALVAGFIILVTITGNLLVRNDKKVRNNHQENFSRLYFPSKLIERSALHQDTFTYRWRWQIWLSDVFRCQYLQWSILRNTGHLTGKNILAAHTRLTVNRAKPWFLLITKFTVGN